MYNEACTCQYDHSNPIGAHALFVINMERCDLNVLLIGYSKDDLHVHLNRFGRAVARTNQFATPSIHSYARRLDGEARARE